MQRYGGTVIFQTHDDDGLIEVVQEGSVRSLHFGSSARQSSIDLNAPAELQLTYTESMLSALLFVPQPTRLLLIGLGGGALLQHLLHHYPECQIDVVEKRAGVIEAARRYFALPDSERVTIHLGDGSRFVAESETLYDLLLVDAYHEDGMDSATDGCDFFGHCRQRLTPNGVVSVNLWSSHASRLEQSIEAMRRAFSGHTLRLPVKGRGNVVALGFQHRITGKLRALRGRAEAMEQRSATPYRQQLRDLRRFNSSPFARLFI